MNTQCPHCQTLFRIEQAQLDAAGGRVRCGHCRRLFDARSHLQKELPLEALPEPGDDDSTQSELAFGNAPAGGVAGMLLSDMAQEPTGRARRPRRSLVGWALVNAALVVVLLGQVLFAQREAFAQDPTLRPVLARMCTVAGCTLPPRRAVDQVELVRRNVYAHPNVKDALIIDITFVNNATFAQPYPILTVSLGNLHGRPLIRRNFKPREYLPELGPNARMAPGSPVHVSLEVRDPGRKARTFEIGFS